MRWWRRPTSPTLTRWSAWSRAASPPMAESTSSSTTPRSARKRRSTEVSFAEWKEVLGIMLDGAFLCTKACVPQMRTRGGGSIVTIGGMTGHSGAKERVHVVTAKAGLAGFTKAVALDVAEFGITVNCVVPGLIGTVRGSHNVRKSTASRLAPMPLGRRGTAQEVAALVRYLCGPNARYVTGQSWHLNGGSYMA